MAKILSIVEEQKRDSVNDMKTLSSMNTLLQVRNERENVNLSIFFFNNKLISIICYNLQGIKASENKTFAHVKELKDALATQSEASEKSLEQSLLAQTEEISVRLKAQVSLTLIFTLLMK